jgi:two-component system sensor histidine kinase/response regulator
MDPKISSFDQKPFILIVDDVPKNLQVLGNILGARGYRFTLATSGVQALKIVKKRLPDLILLDVMMPEMDGFEVCRKLKSNSQTSDIPVVFLTAKSETRDIVKGFDLGGVDYITKPFNSAELVERIRTHLEIVRIGNERKELLHVLCHDLVNPFSSILSAIKVIDDHDTFKRFKGHIQSAAENGLKTIDLVRKIRFLEETKTDMKPEAISIRQIFRESQFMLQMLFSEKQIELVLQIDKSIRVIVEKTSFLNSVINNLITNAIKFSFRGSQVIVTAEKNDEFVKVFIRDFGVGIPPEIMVNLFDMKRTTTRRGTEDEKGTGFGMPLVKRFISLYGGSIEILSKPKEQYPKDHGTEVILTLSAATDNQNQH